MTGVKILHKGPSGVCAGLQQPRKHSPGTVRRSLAKARVLAEERRADTG